MVAIDPWLTLLALLPMPLVTISAHLFGKAEPARKAAAGGDK